MKKTDDRSTCTLTTLFWDNKEEAQVSLPIYMSYNVFILLLFNPCASQSFKLINLTSQIHLNL